MIIRMVQNKKRSEQVSNWFSTYSFTLLVIIIMVLYSGKQLERCRVEYKILDCRRKSDVSK